MALRVYGNVIWGPGMALILLSSAVASAVAKAETAWTDAAAAKLAIADAEQSQGHWEVALKLYHEALELSPNPPGIQKYILFNNIGWSHFHMGNLQKAEEQYQLALAAQPQPPTDHAYINLATLYKSQGKLKATIKAYQSAVALTQQLPTWSALGLHLLKDFRVDEAATALQEGAQRARREWRGGAGGALALGRGQLLAATLDSRLPPLHSHRRFGPPRQTRQGAAPADGRCPKAGRTRRATRTRPL